MSPFGAGQTWLQGRGVANIAVEYRCLEDIH